MAATCFLSTFLHFFSIFLLFSFHLSILSVILPWMVCLSLHTSILSFPSLHSSKTIENIKKNLEKFKIDASSLPAGRLKQCLWSVEISLVFQTNGSSTREWRQCREGQRNVTKREYWTKQVYAGAVKRRPSLGGIHAGSAARQSRRMKLGCRVATVLWHHKSAEKWRMKCMKCWGGR